MWNLFFSTMYNNNDNDDNNQCQTFPGNKFFARSQLTVFENKPTFLKNSYIAYNHSDALQS